MAVCLLRSLDHKNIVKLYAFDQTPTHFILIQELCDLGDLHEVMFSDALLTEDIAISWTGQVSTQRHVCVSFESMV